MGNKVYCGVCGKDLDKTNATEHIDCNTLPSFLDYFFYRINGGKRKKHKEDSN